MHEKSSAKTGTAGEPPAELNRYAPPQANVADAPVVDSRGPRPAPASWAFGMLWVYLALEALYAATVVREMSMEAEALWRPVGFAAVCVAFLGGEAWVIYQVALGKRWARAVALAWFIFRVWTDLVGPWKELRGLTLAWTAIETALMATALSLVFLTPGRRWFLRALED